jgi:hypothetical protein
MASERQRQANRRNGSKGGPKTEAGKQRSRANSLQHGLTSSTLVVLPEEHEHEYEAILHGFRESFQPQDAAEEALVLRLAQAHWRSLRSRRVETGILHITAATERKRAREIVDDCPEHLNPHNAIAVGFMTGPEERWKMYLRYDGAISREFFRTLEMLTRLQKARQPKKPSQEPVIAVAAGAMSDFGIRSVSTPVQTAFSDGADKKSGATGRVKEIPERTNSPDLGGSTLLPTYEIPQTESPRVSARFPVSSPAATFRMGGSNAKLSSVIVSSNDPNR